MEKFELDKIVTQSLSMHNVNRFTVSEIKTTYITIKQDETLNPAEVRRFVYEELLKLVRKGWLIRHITKKKGLTHFTKTDLFDHAILKKMVSPIQYEVTNTSSSISYSQMLIQRLNQYNSELLEGLGALKEYVELKGIYPEQQDDLKSHYMAVQENNHILKGRILALNELINSTKETS